MITVSGTAKPSFAQLRALLFTGGRLSAACVERHLHAPGREHFIAERQ